MITVLMFAAALAAQQNPIIQNPNPTATVDLKYMGDVDCGSWPRSVPYTDIHKAVELNLVLGFLAGRSTLRDIDIESNVTHASIAAWIDNYCMAHPLDSLWAASTALEHELLSRAGYNVLKGQ